MLVCTTTLLVGCKQGNEAVTIQPVKVRTVKMSASIVGAAQEYSGTVEEMSGSSLSFSVGGMVKQVLVAEGERINKGQLIAVVDDESIRNGYEAALAMRKQAEDAYNRMKQLHDNGSLPEIQWVEVESKLKQAVSSEQIAKKSLNDSKLYAPYSGVISEKSVEVGQNVMPGMPAFKLVNISQVKVKVAVPENEISQLKVGQAARVTVAALGGLAFEGKIVEKGITANSLTRSYEIKILIDNAGHKLMPGMICDVYLEKAMKQTAFLLPARVVQLDDNNHSFVWVNVGGRAGKRPVEAGAITNQGVMIEKGLVAGDEVLVEGQQKVSEHTSITVEQ